MTRRWKKIGALVIGGGLLFQVGGCASVLVQLFLQNIATDAIAAIINGLQGQGQTTG